MIDLDAVKNAQPIIETIPVVMRDGEYNHSITLDGIMGFSTKDRWSAADDLRTEIQVQIARLKILEAKANKLCMEYSHDE